MLSNQRTIVKISIPLILSLITMWAVGYSQTATKADFAILQGTLAIEPTAPLPDDAAKIQPGTEVKLKAAVVNKGRVSSPPGEVYIRYAFAKPLHDHEESVIFKTEKVLLEPIQPGKGVSIDFKKQPQLPSLLDFIRYDWPLREYQLIFIPQDSQTEHIIGNLAITFSAYYYSGVKHEIPVEIPANSIE